MVLALLARPMTMAQLTFTQHAGGAVSNHFYRFAAKEVWELKKRSKVNSNEVGVGKMGGRLMDSHEAVGRQKLNASQLGR